MQIGGQTPLNIAVELGRPRSHPGHPGERGSTRPRIAALPPIWTRSGNPKPASDMSDNGTIRGHRGRIGTVDVRPSYLLVGRGMRGHDGIRFGATWPRGGRETLPAHPHRQVPGERTEAEADALTTARTVFVPAVMEHIMRPQTPVDSACVIPP